MNTVCELLGKTTDILYASQEEYGRQGRIRFHLSSEEKLQPYEVAYRKKDGTVFPSETIGTALKDEAGETLGFIELIRDITNRKKAEKHGGYPKSAGRPRGGRPVLFVRLR